MLIAFDYGKWRVGVALGDPLTGARPLQVIPAINGEVDLNLIEPFIRDWQPEYLVIGLPLQADGELGETAKTARSFGRKLKARFALPVAWIDERLSSFEAEERLQEHKQRSAKKQPPGLDAVAAACILESWFSQLQSTQNEPPNSFL